MTALTERIVRVPSETWTDIPEVGLSVFHTSAGVRDAHLFTSPKSGRTHLVLPAAAGTSWAVSKL